MSALVASSAGYLVEVQFERVGARVAELAGEVGPPARRDAVERRDDGHVERGAQRFEVAQGWGRADREDIGVGQEGAGFGVGVDVRVEESVRGELVVDDLFFEHRMQHNGAGARGDEALRGSDVVGERRRADHQRAAQSEAEPVGREVDHLSAPRRGGGSGRAVRRGHGGDARRLRPRPGGARNARGRAAPPSGTGLLVRRTRATGSRSGRRR